MDICRSLSKTLPLFLVLLAGCATTFDYEGRNHTIYYTADLLADIQGDYCAASPEHRIPILSLIQSRLADGSSLVMTCPGEPRFPVLGSHNQT
ncbi:MAG: hypothetical protein O6766_09505 [Gammaproteobacteria bacterium]|nr:hypothetical protein [Gammaproteobacteria bacterium]